MTDFVLVHGAWRGAWCWRRIIRGLWAEDHRAFAVSLSGVGERAHQLSAPITLATHIADVLALPTIEVMRQRVGADSSWQVDTIATGHDAMISAPQALLALLNPEVAP